MIIGLHFSGWAAIAAQSKRPATSQPAKPAIVIDGTLEAALGQPLVHVQISDGKRVLTGEPALGGLLDESRPTSFVAYLDTGAGGCVISHATARRFGVKPREKSAYHEVGLHGQAIVEVSIPYDLAVAGSSGDANDDPPARFQTIQREVTIQLSRAAPTDLMTLLGEMNVLGMPAIRKAVFELDPAPMRNPGAQLGTGPTVRLLGSALIAKHVDVEIPLEYIDFNQRKHPDNRGSLPTLAPNPVIVGVVSERGTSSFKGDWLLDTGAAASIISTKHAQALGLYKADGLPAIEPQFTLPLGGIGGDAQMTGGYIIDRVRISARQGTTLEFRNVHVVVKDIAATLDNGRQVVLDGVLGMNLLLPSNAGMGKGLPDKAFPGPFDRIWIDGPRGSLGLRLHH